MTPDTREQQPEHLAPDPHARRRESIDVSPVQPSVMTKSAEVFYDLDDEGNE